MLDIERRRVLTHHAVDRYRTRADKPGATVDDVALVLTAGRLQGHPPTSLVRAQAADAWVLAGRLAFPVKRETDTVTGEPVLIAVTCLTRPKRSKADRRAFRRDRREEAAWA